MQLGLSNRTFLLALLGVQALFLHDYFFRGVMAITEDENEVGLRDANSSRERPKLDGFDMDEDVRKEIE